jgi:hypothetical protein
MVSCLLVPLLVPRQRPVDAFLEAVLHAVLADKLAILPQGGTPIALSAVSWESRQGRGRCQPLE